MINYKLGIVSGISNSANTKDCRNVFMKAGDFKKIHSKFIIPHSSFIIHNS